MVGYSKTNQQLWTGRKSDQKLYLHEKVTCIHLEKSKLDSTQKTLALLGYACDEGVRRNQGRIGAADGPDAIRSQLGKMPNHLPNETQLIDVGSFHCSDGDMERTQNQLAEKVTMLLKQDIFPIVLGGGHDIAYGHFRGIKNYLGESNSIGVINFDAHFDLRDNNNGNNSGTPFYQIAKDCGKTGTQFNYLCLGIRKDANVKTLFQTAKDLGVTYLEGKDFSTHNIEKVKATVIRFIERVDYIYTTIDIDGFSSAFSPGVSSPYPTGFTPDIVFETLQLIVDSNKLISLDVAEMNPKYDLDNQTAKLAAALVHFVMHGA